MLLNYLKVFLRLFARNRVFTLINFTGTLDRYSMFCDDPALCVNFISFGFDYLYWYNPDSDTKNSKDEPGKCIEI
ncbi:MAG TPA: hypothetical protein ENI20_17780 [Bacteroides sp.]|nr:hypothetical protein [Bacteroides sp.]